jgi:hypothetical protein
VHGTKKHFSPAGHSESKEFGHLFEHLAFASAQLVPQLGVSAEDPNGANNKQILKSFDIRVFFMSYIN